MSDQFLENNVSQTESNNIVIIRLKRLSRNKGAFQDQVLNVFTFPIHDGS